MIFVTGGAGFIGSNFILKWLRRHDESVLNIDKLTYAGNIDNLKSLEGDPRYKFVKLDILKQEQILELFIKHKPRAILHFAAESHVDRSITNPRGFLDTNIMGTYSLLQAAHDYWLNLDIEPKNQFRFLHVSTDEVFGSLNKDEAAFTELTAYAPNSPYSASKASSDHLVRAFFHTYHLPVLTTHCSNNFGPYQFPEKLIPMVIHRALKGEKLPIYGDGLNVRDWLYVDDHCEAIELILKSGKIGQTYNIGGGNEMTNIEVVDTLCEKLDAYSPLGNGQTYKSQKTFVQDRAGHDKRYAINSNKLFLELGWKPCETFQSGIEKTVKWYLENQAWVNNTLHKEQQ